jgi:hypothetical protein
MVALNRDPCRSLHNAAVIACTIAWFAVLILLTRRPAKTRISDSSLGPHVENGVAAIAGGSYIGGAKIGLAPTTALGMCKRLQT